MSIKINKLISNYNFYPNRVDKKGKKNTIQYIVIHYVGALGGAKDNCVFYAGGNRGASAHYYVGFNGEIWQSVEDKDGAWSVGVNENNGRLFGVCNNYNSLNIEMCVRKKNTTPPLLANTKDWYFEDATVTGAVELTAYLMKKYDIDIDHVVRHYDVCGKICPNPYVYNTTKHTWTEFKELLAKAFGSEASDDEPEEKSEFFRVGTGWSAGRCVGQVGAYHGLSNAQKAADSAPIGVTYKVFDGSGKAVYSHTGKVDAKTLTTVQLDGLTEEQKISVMAPLYQQCAKDTGMLASVGLCQFALESGFGTSEVSRKGNNLHGMKATLSGNNWENSTWDGSSVKCDTWEEYNGKVVNIKDDFRKYPCVLDSIYDRAAYFIGSKSRGKRRYPDIEKMTDAVEQIKAIKAGGYATDSKYVTKLVAILKKFNLTQYDPKTPKPSPSPKPEESGKLYHVQVGAYAKADNAAAMKQKLEKDGYEAIIKTE